MQDDLEAGGGCEATGTCGGDANSMIKLRLPNLTVFEQSILAAQQFGVIVGVALLVGSLFMLMVGFEIVLQKIEDKCSKMCGRKTLQDAEAPDPASLVGSFKRYK